MKNIFVFFLFLFFVRELQSGIVLNVYITHRKGLDKGLDLSNELHVREVAFKDERLQFNVKDGPKIQVMASFLNDFSEYGPSSLIKVHVDAFSYQNVKIRPVKKNTNIIPIGQKDSFQFKDGRDQLIDVIVLPEVY